MDVGQMIDFHLEKQAEVSVAAIPVPSKEAREFGVIDVDKDGRIIRFVEKPPVPPEIPGRPGWSLASMGNYVFDTNTLVDQLARNASLDEDQTKHDFGRNILPAIVEGGGRAYCYDFSQNDVPGVGEGERGYWRDVGTIDAYWKANMDLVQVQPVFDLYNPRWPIRTYTKPLPPAKFVFAGGGEVGHPRMGIATDSLISEGCILSGGRVDRSVLSPGVRINSYAHVEESILMDGVDVGRHARLRRVIVDKGVQVPPGAEVGFDHDADRRRGFHVSEEGVVVIAKDAIFTEEEAVDRGRFEHPEVH
jgi:glucose-1-phosphate adenylyltransferase